MNSRSKEEYYARKTLREREAKKRTSESWKTKLKEPVTLFTGILAVLALLQFLAINSTDRATHDLAKAAVDQASIIAAHQRPWVKVENVEPFVHPLDANIGGLNYASSHKVGFLPLHFVRKRCYALSRLTCGWVSERSSVTPRKLRTWPKWNKIDALLWTMPIHQCRNVVDDNSFIRVIFPNEHSILRRCRACHHCRPN